MKTIENNGVILIDPDQEKEIVIGLLIETNAFVSIKTAEILTTLDKTTQYRERKEGRFPNLCSLTHHGRRKAYRVQDLINWLESPADYQQSFEGYNNSHPETDK
jgi:hypothetical protein